MSDTPAPAPAPAAPASSEAAKIKTRAGLWWPRAVLQSFLNCSIDFYPRLSNKDACRPTSQTVGVDLILKRLGNATDGWASLRQPDSDLARSILQKIVDKGSLGSALLAEARSALVESAQPPLSIDDAIDLARSSLAEVKAQTEYQDQKATRLLTVTTFLSALSGALFATFSSAYPLRMLAELSGWWWLALVLAYISFGLFVIAAISGALVTFHATRTRFKYPKEATAKNQEGNTRSFLFFREIIGVTPEAWAGSFVGPPGGALKLRADLKQQYLKNYVIETYLIAAKTADKLRYLAPAQSLLAWALRCLLVFVLLIALIQAMVPKVASQPADIRLVQPTAPVPAEVRLVPSGQAPAIEVPQRRPTTGREDRRERGGNGV